MCGLTAEFAYGDAAPAVSEERLQHINGAMASRGPDGVGCWISNDRRVGLAHRRLAIVELSDAGAQPMATPDGAIRVVFNGEIYNFPQLRQELVARGCSFRSRSDTEVLLHLYRERGADMVHCLRGMFAFALWDATRHALLLARDPLGIKPLYYADDGSSLRAASQVKALKAGGGVDLRPQPAGHAGFFLWGHVPEPWTLYKGIQALPAGCTMWVEQGGRGEIRRYFDLAAELSEDEIEPRSSLADARERFAAAIRKSVSLHMLSDVPVGVFLSSGLDSTSIAALAAEHNAAPLQTITLGFAEYQGTPKDEVPLAEAVARDFGFAHASHRVRREDFSAAREDLLAAMDQPSIDGVNTYFVSKAASESGLKVALSGLGGDELLAGYASFDEIPKLVRYARPLARVGTGLRWITAPLLRHLASPKYAGLLEYGGDFAGAYLLRRGLYMPWELTEVLEGELARNGWADLATIGRLQATTSCVASDRLRICALETAWYMRNQLLRDADWASMAHSLEVRVPLVDVELLREVARLVAEGHPPSKSDMAACAAKPLPRAILERPKSGFSVPVREWLQDETRREGRGLRAWAKTVYRHFVDS